MFSLVLPKDGLVRLYSYILLSNIALTLRHPSGETGRIDADLIRKYAPPPPAGLGLNVVVCVSGKSNVSIQ